MNVIAINGSPRKDGNTNKVLCHMAEQLGREGIRTEIIQVGSQTVHGCIGCGHCWKDPDRMCVFQNDLVNETIVKMRQAEGFILGSPAYYAGIAGTMKSFLDRVFYSNARMFRYKVATAVTVARRAGAVDTLHGLNNYLHLAGTVQPPTLYWNVVYGRDKGEVEQDGEGLQVARHNARAMAWVMKSLRAARDTVPLPVEEERIHTNFVR